MGVLRIGRLRADCHVAPGNDPATASDIARAVENHLAAALRGTLATWLDSDDESVWILRGVQLDVVTADDTPPDRLASVFASALGRALAGTLQGDGDGIDAIRFPNRTAYLARFVTDLAADHPWSRWYYAPFSGLKSLPASAAIRTALTESPERGLAALASLDDHTLAKVTGALAPEDEARLLDALGGLAAASHSNSDAVAAARAGWMRAAHLGVERGRALFAVVRADRVAEMGVLVHAVGSILAEARGAEPVPAGERKTPPASREASSAVISPPRSLAATPAMLADDVRRASDDAVRETPLTTRFGGLFLLLRDLEGLPWAAWTKDWPPIQWAPAPADVLKCLTLSLCAGRARVRDALDDDAVRALFAIPRSTAIPEISLWLREVGSRRRACLTRDSIEGDRTFSLTQAERTWLAPAPRAGIGLPWCRALALIAAIVLRRFAHRLPGFAESTPEHLWRNFLDFEAIVEADAKRVVVRCGRPPLHLVLTLTGMTRGMIAGRDPGNRPILLFPGD
jgi:hypothetical protein